MLFLFRQICLPNRASRRRSPRIQRICISHSLLNGSTRFAGNCFIFICFLSNRTGKLESFCCLNCAKLMQIISTVFVKRFRQTKSKQPERAHKASSLLRELFGCTSNTTPVSTLNLNCEHTHVLIFVFYARAWTIKRSTDLF